MMASTITNSNSREVSDRRNLLESKISQALSESQGKAAEAGAALREIRDDRLYRKTHKSFEPYCQDVWGFNRQQGARLIGYADISDDIAKLNEERPAAARMIMPSLESHSRALVSIPRPDRGIVWEKVLDALPEGDRVTAAHVERVVLQHLQENPPESAKNTKEVVPGAIAPKAEIDLDPGDQAREKVMGGDDAIKAAAASPVASLAEIVASAMPAESGDTKPPTGLVSKIKNFTGENFDFAIMDAAHLTEKMSGALDGLTRSLEKGARVAIFAEPIKACMISADAMALGYEVEHSLAMDTGECPDLGKVLFPAAHSTILVLRWGDRPPRERVDDGLARVNQFAEDIDRCSLFDSRSVRHVAAILLRAFSAPGDRVLCPTGGNAFIGEAMDYGVETTYLCSDQEKLDYYQGVYDAR